MHQHKGTLQESHQRRITTATLELFRNHRTNIYSLITKKILCVLCQLLLSPVAQVAKFEPGGIQMFLHSKNRRANEQKQQQQQQQKPTFFPTVLNSLGKYKNALLL